MKAILLVNILNVPDKKGAFGDMMIVSRWGLRMIVSCWGLRKSLEA